MRSLSAPFILRPVGTVLLSIGLLLLGSIAYVFLPVASLPNVEFPTIRVSASRPGADPATMAASVAAPLERNLGAIAGVNEITSWSSLGSSNIILQFDLNRNIDKAARDVQAALNAAVTDLPGDMPSLPQFRKMNPNAMPVLILALTSDTIPPDQLFDLADSVIAQRLSQLEGVAEVQVNGAEQPALRVRLDPARLAAMGLGTEEIRAAIVAGNTVSPLGSFEGELVSQTLASSGRLVTVADYENLILRSRNGAVVRLGDVASVTRGVRNTRAAGWYNGKPAVLLQITKLPDANVIATVDGVKRVLPDLQRWIPAGVDFNVMSDRTVMIRASVQDLEKSLVLSIALVMMVVFAFLRRAATVIAAGVTVPLSLGVAFAGMWAAGFTIDNLSLMAIVISVGFVVDDAIVMVENINRNIEAGLSPLRAALVGARQIGFTVISISLSLIAAFIPLLFMSGIIGRMFREFSLTLSFAILASAFVSLTVTPMICGRFMGRGLPAPNRFDAFVTRASDAYARSLEHALRRPILVLVIFLMTIGATVQLYRVMPKGMLPQDDLGLLFGWTEASPDVSFAAMEEVQRKASDILAADPVVESIASFVGGGWSVNSGRMFISLKSARSETSQQAIARLRQKLSVVPGIRVYLIAMQDVRVGGRQGRSNFQFTLWSSDAEQLYEWGAKVLERARTVPQVVDVSSDREKEGLQARVVIDRVAAARMGVAISAIDNVLSNAFSQRQISTIYGERNQYKVVLEVAPLRQRDPNDLGGLFVSGAGNAQIPLASIVRIERSSAPLTINHTGPFASVTINYAAAPNVPAEEANLALRDAVANLHLPQSVRADFSGDAKALTQTSDSGALLILAALVAVYIILGILYESLIHPLTIVSTLPSAGLGALIALQAIGMELTLVAFIGIILLIGIVKKNGIMLVDFAIAAERARGLTPAQAIREAARERFRPIVMTTLAAICGAIPIALAVGAGSELRRPLGVTIVGGLLLSQILTLYTTPVIYLLMSRFTKRKEVSLLQKAGLGLPGKAPQI
jgi:multidrug efflux pump